MQFDTQPLHSFEYLLRLRLTNKILKKGHTPLILW